MQSRKHPALQRLHRHTATMLVARPPSLPGSDSQPASRPHTSTAATSSRTFSTSANWRAALLGTVAAGALFLGYGRRAEAQVSPPTPPCDTIAGTTATCTGDVSGGVSAGAPYTVLNVNNLTADITPGFGVDGISFLRTGDIAVNSDTTPYQIITTGAGAQGVFAYSTNGGAVTVDHTGDVTSNNDIGIFAGTYGSGTVSVTSVGDVTALKAGIYAYSYSGGAVIDSTGDVTLAGIPSTAMTSGIEAVSKGAGAVSVISDGDVTGRTEGIKGYSKSGMVSVDSTGDVTATEGYGIYARSEGSSTVSVISNGTVMSADGDGIYADSNGGMVTIESTGDVTSTGGRGIYARSPGSATVEVTSAGTVMAEETGILVFSSTGDVTVDSTGDVTSNTDSGIGASSSGAATVNVTSMGAVTASTKGIYAKSDTGAVTVDSTGDVNSTGGAGIVAENEQAGAISVTSTGDVTAANTGIRAESYLYGNLNGGTVTVISTGNVTAGNIGIDAYSTNGAVTVESTGDVSSANSAGILAITGGSGAASLTSDGNVTGKTVAVSASSKTGMVTLDSMGDLTATGGSAVRVGNEGPAAVSLTSVGTVMATGFGITAYSNGGTVTVDSTGDVSSTTTDAIRAKSAGNIEITLDSGTISGAVDGVEFENGATNTLTINNVVSISGGTNDILGGAGDETVNNYGWLTTPGDVDLGGGINAFNNMPGATFNSGDTVILGGGTLTNDGILSPGGLGTVQTTTLGSDLDLNPGGVFEIDVDPTGPQVDKIVLSDAGGTAYASGGVSLNFLSLPAALGPEIIIETDQTIAEQALVVLNPAVDATITYVDSQTDAALTINGFDFSPTGLNQNQTNIAEHLNDIFNIGGALQDVHVALANHTDLAGIADTLDQLSPEIYADTQIAALYGNLDFSDNLLSCPVNAVFGLEGQCAWVAAEWRGLDVDGTSESIGFNEDAGLFSAGAQIILDELWRVGAALGYQVSELDNDAGASSDGNFVQGGIVAKYTPGPLLLAGVLSGGYGWYDTSRPIAFAGEADSETTLGLLAARFHGSYRLGGPGGYLKPILDANVVYLDFDGNAENGAGAADLVLHDGSETVFTVAPALEFGGEQRFDNGVAMRPYVRGGAVWYSQDDLTVSASFADAPAAAGGFSVDAMMDQWQGVVAAGVDVVTENNGTLRVKYEGRFGDLATDHGLTVEGGMRF